MYVHLANTHFGQQQHFHKKITTMNVMAAITLRPATQAHRWLPLHIGRTCVPKFESKAWHRNATGSFMSVSFVTIENMIFVV